MCLSNASKIKIAKKDIVCWVGRYKLAEGKYKSPYKGCIMLTNKVYKAQGGLSILEMMSRMMCREVGAGCFHSYKNKEDARDGCVVMEAIIPKGTRYYTGVNWKGFSRLSDGYASKKLKLVKEV